MNDLARITGILHAKKDDLVLLATQSAWPDFIYRAFNNAPQKRKVAFEFKIGVLYADKAFLEQERLFLPTREYATRQAFTNEKEPCEYRIVPGKLEMTADLIYEAGNGWGTFLVAGKEDVLQKMKEMYNYNSALAQALEALGYELTEREICSMIAAESLLNFS